MRTVASVLINKRVKSEMFMDEALLDSGNEVNLHNSSGLPFSWKPVMSFVNECERILSSRSF